MERYLFFSSHFACSLNLSQAETINRLLKQRKSKNKHVDDRSPLPPTSGSHTPKVKSDQDADDPTGEDDADDAMDVIDTPKEVKPPMYCWVSSVRSGEELALTS